MSLLLLDFPNNPRGTYRIKSDEDGNESLKLASAKELIKRTAQEFHVTILLDAKMQGSRWVLVWWPANEPRHHETDQIITPEFISQHEHDRREADGTT